MSLKQKYDFILIDDDDINHSNWKIMAEIYTKKIATYYTPEEFYQNVSDVSHDTPIYIDSQLSNGVLGEIEAQNIHKMGFKKIYLCTGHPKGKFVEDMPWIKAIVDKTPPFVVGA